MKNPEILRPEWDVSIKSFLLGIQQFCGRQGEKNIRVRGDGIHQGNKTDAHMNSQRLLQHGQDLHRSKLDGVQ
ncbi:hypothetical protein ACQP3C_30420, partial [Escherichia coli]